MSERAKVLFIGLDAAEPDLIGRWSDEGLLPTFRSLREKGIWAPTANPPRVYNGAVWPSLNTGVVPRRHGRYFYTKLNGYHMRGVRPTKMVHRPFWDVLTDEGLRAALIDVPYANPVAKLNGIQVVDWLVHDRTLVPEEQRHTEENETVAHYDEASDPKLHTFPASLSPQVLHYGSNREVPASELSGRSTGAFRRFRDRLIERIEAKTNFSIQTLKDGQWDLFMTVFHEAHDVGHECWHFHDSAHPDHDPEYLRQFGDPILDVYQALDRSVGRILELADPDTTTIVFSSHGMGPTLDGNSMLDLVLTRLVEHRTPRGLTAVDGLNRAWGAIPAGLRTHLSPLRNRVRKKLHEALVGSTRRDRKCFAISTNAYCGGIRINLVGREPNGRIHPGEEFDRFCADLKKDLLELVDGETGEPAVRAVLGYEEMFPRDIYTEDLHSGEFKGDRADLLVEWTKRTFKSLASPKVGRIEKTNQNSRTGDHLDIGMFLASGKQVQAGTRLNSVPVIDIAPTIASLLGVQLPDADGTPLSALLRP